MKNLWLYLSATITMVGCSFSGYDVLYYTDFTRYADDGFVVSSISDFAGHPYVALGDISLVSVTGTESGDDKLNAQKILDKVVAAAQKKGANGVIGYRSNFFPGNSKERPYWSASGVAILFEDAPALKPNFSQGQNPEKIHPNVPQKNYVKLIDTDELINQTVAYAIENDMPLNKAVSNNSGRVSEMQVLDLSTKEYISIWDFYKKYSRQTYSDLMQKYREAKKTIKK